MKIKITYGSVFGSRNGAIMYISLTNITKRTEYTNLLRDSGTSVT
jgi:hypothetical protein